MPEVMKGASALSADDVHVVELQAAYFRNYLGWRWRPGLECWYTRCQQECLAAALEECGWVWRGVRKRKR